jgi:hypothetical protein
MMSFMETGHIDREATKVTLNTAGVCVYASLGLYDKTKLLTVKNTGKQ